MSMIEILPVPPGSPLGWFEAKCGRAHAYCYVQPDGSPSVGCLSATRPSGRPCLSKWFHTWDDALAHYRSADMRRIIEAARQNWEATCMPEPARRPVRLPNVVSFPKLAGGTKLDYAEL